MKKTEPLLKLPRKIAVEIKKGESGRFLAYLPEFDIFTEATDPSHLIFQVNDLIYAHFDVPKKYQAEVRFYPPLEVQDELFGIDKKLPKVQFNSFYAPNSSLLEYV